VVLPLLHQSMKLGMWRGCRRMVWQDDRKCEFDETERNTISHHPCMLDDLAGERDARIFDAREKQPSLIVIEIRDEARL
jgi:hypothetical protein